MNTRKIVILGAIIAFASLMAITANTYATAQYYAPELQSMIPSMMGGNSGNNMMNQNGMMGSMMSGQSMNAQQCQQPMPSGGSQMMNGQDHMQQCQQQMNSDAMTAEQCQAMH